MPDLYYWQGGTKSIIVCQLTLNKGCQLWKPDEAQRSSTEVGNSVWIGGKVCLTDFADGTLGCKAFSLPPVSIDLSVRSQTVLLFAR